MHKIVYSAIFAFVDQNDRQVFAVWGKSGYLSVGSDIVPKKPYKIGNLFKIHNSYPVFKMDENWEILRISFYYNISMHQTE